MMIGSEGILGVITEVSVRIQSLPVWKATASVTFEDFFQAAEAVRLISQSGLFLQIADFSTRMKRWGMV